MQNHPGVFIVLEGSDGSGKGTQFRLLAERLKAVGHDVSVFDFPRYEEPSTHFVKSYLNGDYGPANEVSPYTASMFYALDRYEAAPQIKAALAKGSVVLANRYVGSNMAHQGTKFSRSAQQRGFFLWAESLEYQLLGIPRPNINLFLKVPAEISYELIANKSKRGYTNKKRDEHEADRQHTQKAVSAYDLLCRLFPKDFKKIDCTEEGNLLSIVEINEIIWDTIKPLLPTPKRKPKSITISLDEPMNTKNKQKTSSESSGSSKHPDNRGDRFVEITKLKDKMLAQGKSFKDVKRLKFQETLELLTPLYFLKSEIEPLLSFKSISNSPTDDEPVAVNKIIEQLSRSIPESRSGDELKLLSAKPLNEFQILRNDENTSLNYQQKEQALLSELNGALRNFKYSFDVISNYSIMLAVYQGLNHGRILLTATGPRLGYNQPEIIETAGLDEPFQKAFELSNKLYKQMLASDGEDAIYALLMGHNVRWEIELSAEELVNTLKASKKKYLLVFLGTLLDKIAEKHPHVARSISVKILSRKRKTPK